MAKILWGPLTPVELMTNDLNGLVNLTGNALSTAIPTANYQFLKLSLYLNTTAGARSASAYVKCYLLPSMGTEYPDTATEPLQAYAIQHFYFKAITGTETAITTNIFLPFGDVKIYVQNNTGQTFNATGNILSYQLGSSESVVV